MPNLDASGCMPGRFIVFEGGEGAGKTTQQRLLASRLRALGRAVVETREPGGCLMAERIRSLLVSGQPGELDGRTELFLLLAARVEHVRSVIGPALAQGVWVLCDRFGLSTLAYQGFGRGLPVAQLEGMHRLAVDGLVPDRVVVLDIDPEVGLRRVV
ncbi:MAG: dTMP kinase, partial [Magnetococcales bacterium]|nr:dTMP kinase [Magnetococcales bacterium]